MRLASDQIDQIVSGPLLGFGKCSWLEIAFFSIFSLIWPGSYEIFVDEKWAKAAFEANAANSRPFTDEAEEVDAASASAKDAPGGPDGSDGDGGDGGDGGPNGGPDVPNADVKEDSLMESVRHHRGHHRKHAKGRWRS